MMNIKSGIYILYWLLFFWCITPAVGQLKGNGEAYLEKIPIETQLGLLFTTVYIQGKPYKLLIDSGAPFVLFKNHKKDIKYHKSKKNKIRDSNQQVKKVRSVYLDDVSLGSLKYDKVRALLLDLEGPILNCLQFDGILGANLMAHSIWQFHRDSHYILVANDTSRLMLQNHAAQTMKLKGWQKSPYISVSINQHDPTDALFDTGFTNYFTLPNKLFVSLSKANPDIEVKKFFGFGSEGAFGRALETTAYILVDTLAVGDYVFTPASFHLDNNDKPKVGVKYLHDRVITLDFIHRMFYASKGLNNESIKAKTYGFSANIRDDKIIVGTIERGSDLEKRISVGDLILQVNDLKLDHGCDDLVVLRNLMNSSAELTFKIKTKRGVIEVETVKHDIF